MNMINKECFVKFISKYKEFDTAIERISNSISGKKYSIDLFESDWYEAVGDMLDTFLKSHFTEDGIDIITWWLFEDVDHTIWQQVEPTLFEENTEIKYHLNTIDDLWNYLVEYKEDYFLYE